MVRIAKSPLTHYSYAYNIYGLVLFYGCQMNKNNENDAMIKSEIKATMAFTQSLMEIKRKTFQPDE
jgi:hypothetical protein